MWTSILGMNPNCLYAEPGDWTRVAEVQGEAANHYTNDAMTRDIERDALRRAW